MAALQQQTALARFGELALESEDLDEILHEACRLVGAALGTDLAKIMEVQAGGETLLVRAGVGWSPGIVGHVTVSAGERSSEGEALRRGEPVTSSDIRADTRFDFPAFLFEHGVCAMADVVIRGGSGRPPYGVLEIDSRACRTFAADDIAFLQTYANLLGGAVCRIASLAQSRSEQQSVQANEARLRLALEVGRLATWDWDIATGAVKWSDEHFRMQGYVVGEVAPSLEAWAARVHPEDLAETLAALDGARDQHHEYVHEFRNLQSDGSVRWLSARGRYFYGGDGTPVRMIGVMQDVTERREWEEIQRTLVAELQHRTRNLLGVVKSIAAQTMRMTGSVEEFREHFNERLTALSRVQALLSHAESEPITIGRLIDMELDALGGRRELRELVELSGPRVPLRNSVVQILALAIHELATNARKHGSLAGKGGRLTVSWERREEANGAHLFVDWREVGLKSGLVARGGAGSGFGRYLIEQALPYQLGGKTSFALSDTSLRCTIDLPLGKAAPRSRA